MGKGDRLSTILDDYGWRDAGARWHVRHLAAVIVSELQQFGARKVLDLGCGNGALSVILAQSGFEVVGVDPDERGVEIAKQAGFGRFVVASCYDDPIAMELVGFDAVVCLEVIEHLWDPSRAVQFARRAMGDSGAEKRGLLVVSTPYHGYLKNLVLSCVNGWDRHWNPLRIGGHIKFFSKRTLRRLLEANGFDVIRISGYGRMPGVWKTMVGVAVGR
jgi:2-polyprenyl-3-methyl-5-hydroxy-6-metoxy-1,4-benzoquinol methylase